MKNVIEKIKIYGVKVSLKYFLIDLKKKLYNEIIKKSYSQNWEDVIIDKRLHYKIKGFYVDIGAYDPDKISNTKRFYLKGWTGINIEPNKVNYLKFLKTRQKDINLNIGIGNDNKKLTFYHFIPDTLSTFSTQEAKKYISEGFKLLEKRKVNVKKLEHILSAYVRNRVIDFISIDTEGFEMEVLSSNDWRKYRPNLIIIECNRTGSSKEKIMKIEKFFNKIDYKKIYANDINFIYQNNNINLL